jgi:peptidoglycan/xylan/chitin deacetylase (PgdA/CDA1 family)
MQLEKGVFTVSLDFELYWGVRDIWSLGQYKQNLQGVEKAVPELLRLFRRNDIHATWATVGFLFCESRADVIRNLPTTYPDYQNKRLSPYDYIDREACLEPTCHFAPELIDQIRQHAGQEIATHTFSHYDRCTNSSEARCGCG